MNNYSKKQILFFSAVSALVMALASTESNAQEAKQSAQTANSILGEIIVTARRRNEKLQDVPQAVSVVTAKQLQAQLVNDQNDLQAKVPSLSIGGRYGHSGGTYGIRGLSGTGSSTPSVGTYFAEVPTPTNNLGYDSSAGTALYDLESVQVLKGPQGTLFGRSTTAGAVLVTPAAPNPSEIEANGSLSLGNLGLVQGTLAVSFPIIDNVLAVRVAGNYNHRNGYTKQIGSGERYDELNNDAQRVSVLFQPTDWFKNTTIYDRFHVDQAPAAFILRSYNPGLQLFNLPPAFGPFVFGGVCTQAVNAGLSPDVATCANERLAILADIKAAMAAEVDRSGTGKDALREFAGSNTLYPIERSTHETVVNRTEITLPPLGPLELQLKNIFGYQKTTGVTALNVGGIQEDATLLYIGAGAGVAANQSGNDAVIGVGPGNKFYSNETQLSGTLFGDRLVFVGGYYYQRAPETVDTQNVPSLLKLFGGVLTPNLGWAAARSFTVGGRSKQEAVYAQATLGLDGLIDGVHVTAGFRHTKDDFLLQTAGNQTDPVTGVITPTATITTQTFESSGNNYNFSIDYKATPNLLLYVSHRKGYVPGGLNSPSGAGGPNYRSEYLPEKIKDYEVGFKWDFNLGGTRGRLNAAAYRADYTDIQRTFSATVNGVVSNYVANVAKAKLSGFETELTIVPTDNLTLGFNYSLNNAKYTKWIGADPLEILPGNIDLSGQPFQNAPKHKLNLNATYDIPLANDRGTISLSAQYTYQSRSYYLTYGKRYVEAYPDTKNLASQKGYGLVNAHIDWRDILGHEGISASIFARNLFDKLYATSINAANNNLGGTVATYSEPRIVGLNVSFQY